MSPQPRDEVNERKNLTPLTDQEAEAMRSTTYANLPGKPAPIYSDHKIETELFGCTIVDQEIRCSFRVKGYIYRPGMRAKTKPEGYVLKVVIPAAEVQIAHDTDSQR